MMNKRINIFVVAFSVSILVAVTASANPAVGRGAAWALGAVLGPVIDWSIKKYLDGDNSAQAASPRNIPPAIACFTPLGWCPIPPMSYPQGEECFCVNPYNGMQDYGITR
jgi:hypothetical protein